MNKIRILYRKIVPCSVRRFFRTPKEQILISYYRHLRIQGIQINQTQKREKQIIVSLTSYPARLHNVGITIKSIMSQTMKPDQIILYLGEDTPKDAVPESLLKLKKNGLSIIFVKQNSGSYKKFLYSFKDYWDEYVLTIDDDLIYPRDMIETLYKAAKKNPNCIIARRCHLMLSDLSGKILPYSKWKLEEQSIVKPSMSLFATTGAGTLFRPSLFLNGWDDNNTFMSFCKNADDIWIKFMCIKSNVPILFTPSQRVMPIEIIAEDFNSLKYLNMTESNDKCINRLQDLLNINLSEYAYILKENGEIVARENL